MILNFIINYPFLTAIIYIILGIVTYLGCCWLDIDKNLTRDDIVGVVIIIIWPAVIIALLLAATGKSFGKGLSLLFAPILRLGENIQKKARKR